MIRWGKVFFGTTEDDVRLAIANQVTIIAMADDNVAQYKRLGCVVLGSLLPPYQSICAEIDGDLQNAAQIYFEYLYGEQCMASFASIFMALANMKDIMFFVPPDEAKNLSFSEVFLRFMNMTFGVMFNDIKMPNICESINNNNRSGTAAIIDLLFTYKYIGIETYAKLLPVGEMPSQSAIPHILENFNYRFSNMNDCINYCMQIIESIRNRPIEMEGSPVVRVNPQQR
jgi:hypothetical protein